MLKSHWLKLIQGNRDDDEQARRQSITRRVTVASAVATPTSPEQRVTPAQWSDLEL